MSRRSRAIRAAYPSITIILLAAMVFETWWLWRYIDAQSALGADYQWFRGIAEHWLQTGEFYLPRQLSGPYVVETLVDVLYPPIALYLFVPFTILPAVLWWAVPIGVFAVAIAWLRPARWTWPLIALGIAWPQTISQVLYGNTNMWIAAFIAAGVVWAWPSVLVLIKPSLALFALIGINRRRWWLAMGILVLAAVPFGSLWADYVTAMANSSLGLTHGLVTLPLMLAPIVAWVGRDRERRTGHLQPDSAAEAVPDINDLELRKIE